MRHSSLRRVYAAGGRQAGQCLLIPPGVRHRAIGEMTVLIVVIPKFDPADEHFD